MIKAELVKELRERTGSGIMDCKKALQESGGDMEKAIVYLRERGLAVAAKKAGRVTGEGLVESYIHAGGKIGVLIEVNCETDFVAKTDDYHTLCKELAMQVAAANPTYVGRSDVPQETIDAEKSVLEIQARNDGKPEKVIEKIVNGRIEKFYKDICLLEQPYIRDSEKIVQDLVSEYIAKLGENIVVNRFCRFKLGEER
ncbi:MAG: translation elongation factor Ts [Syntrophaceticus sp.]|nr:translation elongation factor Ts [Syntrophaceticus sp.]MDD3313891.1 translation elongation factor Ts [Syntrophaceticus sp.]MDD4358969.1 translation elongation factor Ts [Syntrophaceticus sp.]MDD4782533.1 translation elongation factor Ts [Syntrophaceticus sp.]